MHGNALINFTHIDKFIIHTLLILVNSN